MEVAFRDAALDKLETDIGFSGGYSQAIVSMFRRRMQFIRGATDERDFYALKSLHFEKLKGDRGHQRSMRINDQWRLILEFDRESSPAVVVVVGIEDYH